MNLAADGAGCVMEVLRLGADAADVIAGLAPLLLQNEMQNEVILALETAEVAGIKL